MENKNYFLNLTIEPTESKLDKVILYEHIDVKVLDKLINSDLLRKEFHNPSSALFYENEKQQLINYKKLIKNGKAKIIYNRAKNIKYGRVTPDKALGLFSIRREIRHTLAKGHYIDIDIENCHPVLLLQICEANNIKCKYLAKYVTKRDKYLQAVMDQYNVDRDSAKKLFIRLMYFGTFDNWLKEIVDPASSEELDFIYKFSNELKVIGNIILEKNPDLKKVIEKRKEDKDKNYNLVGSVVSYYLQEYESRILEAIYLYCVDNKYIIDSDGVLCADGLMIAASKYNDDLLIKFSELVSEKLGFILKFTTKEFNQDYLTILNEHTIKSSYENIKDEFEKVNFKILNPLSFATIKPDNNLIIRSRSEFKDVYENLIIEDDDQFINVWLKDPTNRTYDKIDFLPTQESPSNIYNTFKGFAGELATKHDVNINDSLIMKHIKEVICNNNDEVFIYFINFLANLLQHPQNKANTALIIKSVQGAGKDTIFNWFGHKILGSDYYFNDDSAELLFGRFNSCIENKILCILNEASGKDTFTINEKIKNAITRNINTIEKKGMTPYENNNNIGYVFLTNNDQPVKVPHDDRRFTGFECSSNNANDKEYFSNLYAEINNGLYDRAFYEFFINIDLSKFDFTNKRPITSFYANMKELNIPILARYFENIVNTNNSLYSCTASELFNKFNEFVKSNNFKVEYTSTKFGIEIKNFEGIEKKKTRLYNIIEIDINKLKEFLIKKYKIEFCEDFIDDDNDKNNDDDNNNDDDDDDDSTIPGP